MDDNNGMIGMALGSWLIALAGGTLAGTMLWVVGGWTFFQGAFMGGVIFVVAGAVISWIMTRTLPEPNELELTTPDVPSKPAPNAAAPKAEAPKAAPVAAAPPKAKAAPSAPKTAAAPKAEAKPEPQAEAPAAPADDSPRPAILRDTPDGGQADDLKKISGVGPKLEQTLNELGVWHYEQVANFTEADIAWVDSRLRFKGRIERDDWIGQAKALAAGGDA